MDESEIENENPLIPTTATATVSRSTINDPASSTDTKESLIVDGIDNARSSHSTMDSIPSSSGVDSPVPLPTNETATTVTANDEKDSHPSATDADTTTIDTTPTIDTMHQQSPPQDTNEETVEIMAEKLKKAARKFQPGDHVIRWEMLPIAWPIQVHGIVLSVSDTGVILVDFGLTAVPQQPQSQEQQQQQPASGESEEGTQGVKEEEEGPNSTTEMGNAEASTTPSGNDVGDDEVATKDGTTDSNNNQQQQQPNAQYSIFSSNPREMDMARKELERKLSDAFTKRFRSSNKKRQRLNVLVLQDVAEIQKWKKVNYDGGLFGFGGGSSSSADKQPVQEGAVDEENGEDCNDKEFPKSPRKKNAAWWARMKQLGSKQTSQFDISNREASEEEGKVEDADATTVTTTTSMSSKFDKSSSRMFWWRRCASPTSDGDDEDYADKDVDIEDDDVDDQVQPLSSQQEPPTDKATAKPATNKKSSSWWRKLAKGVAEEVEVEKSVDNNPSEDSTAELADGNTKSILKDNPAQKGIEVDSIPPTETVQQLDASTTTPLVEGANAEKNGVESEEQGPKSSRSFLNMNPAMARLMERKRNSAPNTPTNTNSSSNKNRLSSSSSTKWPDVSMGALFKRKNTHSSTKPESGDSTTESNDIPTTTATTTKRKLDLPKDDPAKLVLARTRWLLEHGEAVLPPYHAFHSNSECIAVFCKTGYWSTLQSDVFLHSTAIGNAKTMGAATLGVAASVPFLAPVVAGVGIGLVAAPWWILHSSKQQAESHTQTLTDQFWAQAEPEVFVECIQQWSKLDEYYSRLEKRKQQQKQQTSNAVIDTPVVPEITQQATMSIPVEHDG